MFESSVKSYVVKTQDMSREGDDKFESSVKSYVVKTGVSIGR